ncbi:tetratricopeptide repeat-containing sensor histidine kinase [Polaribacter aquimarinus]|uniref:tetratricopeptide repeat-containing sensor histidine kinase n=1 Tax=Polaribacter aquimarinus TaxID=2100726 RepID=UPI0015E82504|nr:tetratricopeptide repeat-containing sensor histidine kinase [Polaribacter aquimarinus]
MSLNSKSQEVNNVFNKKDSISLLLKKYRTTKDSLFLNEYYYQKALYFKKKYKTDSSFFYYNKSKNISVLLKDSLKAGKTLLSMASILRKEGDFLGSEITTIQGLRLVEPLGDIRLIFDLYNELGIALLNLRRYKESRKMFNKAYEMALKGNSKSKKDKNTAIFFINMAINYTKEGNYKKSIEYRKKCLKIDSLKTNHPKTYAGVIGGIGSSYFNLGDAALGLKYYLEALKLRKKINYKLGICTSHTMIGYLYLQEKNFKKAKEHSLKGLEYAKLINSSPRMLQNYWQLSQVVEPKKAKEYLKEYILLNEKLIKKERNAKNRFAKIIFETEKKDIENATLKTENDKKQLQLESEKQQKLIGWLVAGTSILFIAFGYVIVNNRKKKLLFKAKLQQIEAREKERQQIAKSLHDEVAGDIRILYKKLKKNNLTEESKELDRVNNNVRNLSHQLSSVSFDEVSFKDQIVNLVSDYFDANFLIRVKEINTVQWKEVNNSIKRTLFLTIRESLQNIDKYAEANNVILGFGCSKKSLILSVKDDGKGFDINSKKSGIGLKNMKERIEEVNGLFSIESEPKNGTTITIEIPNNGKQN